MNFTINDNLRNESFEVNYGYNSWEILPTSLSVSYKGADKKKVLKAIMDFLENLESLKNKR